MTATDRRTRRLALLAAIVTTWLCLALTAAPHAVAHGDDGYFEDLRVEVAAGLEVTVDAILRYENDDDPASGATVTLVAEGPQGEVVGPVRMAEGAEPGRYTGTTTLTTTGSWVMRLSSLEPDGVLRSTQEVQAPGDGEPADPADSSSPQDSGEPTGTAEATGTTGSAEATATPDATPTASSPQGAMVVEATARSTRAASVGTWAAAAAAVALVGAAVWLAVARRR